MTAEELGDFDRVAVDADSVVTLAHPKTGLTDCDGAIPLADIGLPAGVYEELDVPPFAFDEYVVGLTSP